MSRCFLAALVLFSACPPPHMEPGSTIGESSGTDASSGSEPIGADDSASSAGVDASGSQSASHGGSASSSTTDTTGEDTTGPSSFCGDGVVDPGEECDDDDPDDFDECNGLCVRQRVIFASSEQFSPADLGGLYFADGICKQLAGAAGLAHSETFVAWLSDSKHSAASRILLSKGTYARPDGVIVARDYKQLTSGELDAPINVTEKNVMLEGGSAWTGTLPNGDAVPGAVPAVHCNDWKSKSALVCGHYGLVGVNDGAWTYVPDPEINPSPCAGYMHIYCVEGE